MSFRHAQGRRDALLDLQQRRSLPPSAHEVNEFLSTYMASIEPEPPKPAPKPRLHALLPAPYPVRWALNPFAALLTKTVDSYKTTKHLPLSLPHPPEPVESRWG